MSLNTGRFGVELGELLLEPCEGANRKLFEFFKQRFIHGLEIEARFTLHARLQFFGGVF